MPKSVWLGLSGVGVLFCAMIFWHSSKSAKMMYVRIFPVMNLILFLFDILSLGILLVEYLCYHGFHVLANLHEVLIEDALTLITALEGVELGQWHILAFFFLDVCHIKIGLAIDNTLLILM